MATIYYKNTNGRLYYMETTKYITQLDILHMDKGNVEISIKPLDWEHRDLATEIIKKSEFLEVYLKAAESINADSGITIIPIETIDYGWPDTLKTQSNTYRFWLNIGRFFCVKGQKIKSDEEIENNI